MNVRLTAVELLGFKSFGKKTTFTFEAGVTAIVGPNGSGKSNFADAVRWVLGEQSFRELRCRRSDELFFAGGAGRASSGLAQVSLTLETTDLGPSESTRPDAAELNVARRVYRSGESEYYLNRERARLRDVVDVLGHYSLGLDGFAVVGQGAVDAALSARAEDRHQLVEQAAGIGHLHYRLAETQSRLAATEQNLTRISDLVDELVPRLRALDRQARQIRERETLQAEFLTGLLRWYSDLCAGPWASREAAEAERAALLLRLAELRQALIITEASILPATTSQERSDAELAARFADVGALESDRNTLLAAVEADERAVHALKSRQSELLVGVEHWRSARRDDLRQIDELERRQTDFQARAVDLEAGLETAEAELAALVRRRIQLERDAEVARAEVDSNRRRRSSAQARFELSVERCQRAERTRVELDVEEQTVRSELESTQVALNQVERRHDAARAELAATELARRAALADMEQRGQRQSSAARKLSEADREVEGLRSRLDGLRSLEDGGAGYYPGVRAVLRAANGHGPIHLTGVEGIVARLLTVSPDLELAVEVALGSHSQDVVVARWSDAEAAIQHLKSTASGRATFLPLDTLRPARRGVTPVDEGIIGVASGLVGIDSKYTAVSEFLLGQTLVVETLAVARQALSRVPPFWQIVTRDGEVARPSGVVTGGSASGPRGTLARQRELRTCERNLLSRRDERELVAAALGTAIEDTNRARTRLVEAVEASNRSEENARRAASAVEDAKSNVARLGPRVETLRMSGRRLKDQSSAFEASRRDAAAEAGAAKVEGETAEAALRTADGALREFDRSDVTRNSESLARRAQHAQVVDQIKSLSGDLERVSTRCRAVEVRVADHERLADEADKELLATGARLEKNRQCAGAVAEETSRARDQLALVHRDSERFRQELARLVARRIEEVEEVRTTTVSVQNLDRQIERAETELEGLSRQIQLELGAIDPDAFRAGRIRIVQPEGPTSETPFRRAVDLDHLRDRLNAIRARLRVLPTGGETLAEYEAVRDRVANLKQQFEDLTTSAETLRQAVAETQTSMSVQFEATFDDVSRAFSRRFVELFGGGAARLARENDETGQGGVEVVAQVPGKRAQSLAMLSGGERALTAAALLFALIEARPPPFCLLDEVDAALDENNVVRFCGALGELSQRTQFIVITHNRRTMESANAIYGLTLEGQCETRLLSMRLPG